jgi:hypothetical protein
LNALCGREAVSGSEAAGGVGAVAAAVAEAAAAGCVLGSVIAAGAVADSGFGLLVGKGERDRVRWIFSLAFLPLPNSIFRFLVVLGGIA